MCFSPKLSDCFWSLGLKKKLFVSCNGSKKNRVGRSMNFYLFIYFLVKNVCFMHVLR